MQTLFNNDTIQASRWQADNMVLNYQVIDYQRFVTQRIVYQEEMLRLHFGLKGDCRVKFNHLGNKGRATQHYELGYSSPQHFHNVFKKEFGVTPAFVRQTP